MTEYTNNVVISFLNVVLMHMLWHCGDMLQDYTHGFSKTKANSVAMWERNNFWDPLKRILRPQK